MDKDRPYVGEHTPLVKLSSSEEHGIQQAGLAVRKGKSYRGRVVLAGNAWHDREGESDLGQCRE